MFIISKSTGTMLQTANLLHRDKMEDFFKKALEFHRIITQVFKEVQCYLNWLENLKFIIL